MASTRAAFSDLLALASSATLPARRIELLEGELRRLADKLLGRRARDFLAAQWLRFGDEIRDLPFDPATPDLHASHAYLQAGNWRGVADVCAACKEPGGNHPQLLARHAQALQQLRQPDAARRLWCRIAWTTPEALDALIAQHGNSALQARWQAFNDAELELPTAQFPAWLLLADAHQLDALPQAIAMDDEAAAIYNAFANLLKLQRDDADTSQARRALQKLSPSLLDAWLRTRHNASPQTL